jgi:coatomer protein complex subunit alpha (xenin)
MLKIAEIRKDISSQFHNALYLGDVEERVRVLNGAGQGPLAYLTAVTHGLNEQAQTIAAALRAEDDHLPSATPDSRVLIPPEATCDDQGNWPLLTISRGFFDNAPPGTTGTAAAAAAALAAVENIDTAAAGEAWGEDELDLDEDGVAKPKAVKKPAAQDGGGGGGGGDEEEGAGWGADDDLDLGLDIEAAAGEGAGAEGADGAGFFVAPTRGVAQSQIWVNNSTLVADHVAAGAFDSAMQIMKKQLGIVVFEPFRPQFISAYARSRVVVVGSASAPPMFFHTHRNWKDAGPRSEGFGGWGG